MARRNINALAYSGWQIRRGTHGPTGRFAYTELLNCAVHTDAGHTQWVGAAGLLLLGLYPFSLTSLSESANYQCKTGFLY
eukprot:scaffold201652_cov15-Tisochrysis_lutea.AAC.1